MGVRGFSLIEVLVASFILFLVIGTVTITFSGSVKSTLSATESINLHGYTPLIAEHISLSVQSGERSGSSRFIDVDYNWTTQLIEEKPLIQFFDEESTEFRVSDRRAYLWKVVLTTRYNDRSLDHEFNVVTW